MSTEMFAKLAAEFPRNAISWRCQTLTKNGDKGLALAYIDARDVMNRLDTVVGPAGWSDRYEVHGTKTMCLLSLRVGDEWITKTDGAGDTDVEAEKGSISDAFKRVAVKWGIGRYLYDIESPWVPCETYEKNNKFYWKRWTADPWSCVRQPRAAPVEVKQRVDDAKTAAVAYVALAKTALLNAEFKEDVDSWWHGEVENREKNGVVPGTTEHSDLKAFAAETKRGLPYADLRAAG